MNEKPGSKVSFTIHMNDRIDKIEVDVDDLMVFGRKIAKNMVSAIEDVGKASLGKVQVDFEYYDFTGNKEKVSFLMNENEFHALKKTLGK